MDAEVTVAFMVDPGDGREPIPHTPEEYGRLIAGVDMEAAMTLGSPLYDGTASDFDEYVIGPGKP